MDGRTEVTRTWFDKLTTNGLLFHATTLPNRQWHRAQIGHQHGNPQFAQPPNRPIGQLQRRHTVNLAQIVRSQCQPFTTGIGDNGTNSWKPLVNEEVWRQFPRCSSMRAS